VIFGKNKNAQERVDEAEAWSGRATLLILVGILLEIAALFIFPHAETKYELVLLIGANAAIGIGLVIEYGCILRSIKANAELKIESDRKLTEAVDRAAKIEQEFLEFRKSRRRIFSPASPEFIREMSPHQGTAFDTGLDAGGESMHFLWDLGSALTDAGWNHIPWVDPSGMFKRQGDRISGNVSATNVEIHIHPESRATLGPIAADLIAALATAGIEATDEGWNVHSTNANAMHILVGPKG
jgi:hypothetical protein